MLTAREQYGVNLYMGIVQIPKHAIFKKRGVIGSKSWRASTQNRYSAEQPRCVQSRLCVICKSAVLVAVIVTASSTRAIFQYSISIRERAVPASGIVRHLRSRVQIISTTGNAMRRDTSRPASPSLRLSAKSCVSKLLPSLKESAPRETVVEHNAFLNDPGLSEEYILPSSRKT
jgi:hypothetical protein